MILLVGAGAVGTIVAGHLAAAGREPLAIYTRDKDRAAMEQLDELRIERIGGQPLVVRRPALRPSLSLADVDYLLIGVKFPQLESLLDQLGAIPPHCTLVSTLNGLDALRLIRRRLPQARLLPMTIMFNGQLLGPLHAQITTRAQLYLGGHDPRLRAAFAGSGMGVKEAEGDAAAWGKLLINLANALCAATHTTFRDLLTQPDLRASYVAVLDEAVGLLRHTGTPFQLPMPIPYGLYRHLLAGRSALPWWFARLRNGLQDGAYPSMVADIDAGRVTEVAQLNGEVVRLAAAAGLQAPVNARLQTLIQGIEGQPAPAFLRPAELRAALRATSSPGRV